MLVRQIVIYDQRLGWIGCWANSVVSAKIERGINKMGISATCNYSWVKKNSQFWRIGRRTILFPTLQATKYKHDDMYNIGCHYATWLLWYQILFVTHMTYWKKICDFWSYSYQFRKWCSSLSISRLTNCQLWREFQLTGVNSPKERSGQLHFG